MKHETRIDVRVTLKQKNALKLLAERDDRSVASIIHDLINSMLAKKENAEILNQVEVSLQALESINK
jgi:hypothetical protein